MKELIQLKKQHEKERYPNVPEYALPSPKYTDTTSNGLTRMIIEYLRLKGWQCERINTTGRYLDNHKSFTDVIGRTKVIGSGKWIPSSGQVGSADISATIAGRSVKIEIKIGRDKQSKHQAEYQRQIEASGGIYLIARSFKDFKMWYYEVFG